MGWTTHALTITVPQPGHASAINCQLLSQYGLISMDHICKYALTYVFTDSFESAKDNMMCYMCIMMSLSEEGRKELQVSCNATM